MAILCPSDTTFRKRRANRASRSVSDEGTLALVKRLYREYVRQHLGRIGIALGCMAIVALSTAAFTQLIKPIIDDIFISKHEDMLLPIAIAALIIFTVKGFATYGQAVLMSFVGPAHRRRDAEATLWALDRGRSRLLQPHLDRQPGGALHQTTSTCCASPSPIRLSVSAKIFSPRSLSSRSCSTRTGLLALIAFVAFPTAVIPIVRIGQRMRRVSDRSQVQVGLLTTLLDETFQGIRYVKAYAMEAYEKARAGQAIETVFRLNYKASRTRSMLHPIMEVLGGLAMVAVIIYGGDQVISGAKAPGSFFAFTTALLLAYEPLKRLAKLNSNLQEGLAAAARVFTLLDREPEIRDSDGAAPLKITGGAVRFDRVTFSYGDKSPALHDVILEVPAGKTVALVGPSGAGKSTITNPHPPVL